MIQKNRTQNACTNPSNHITILMISLWSTVCVLRLSLSQMKIKKTRKFMFLFCVSCVLVCECGSMHVWICKVIKRLFNSTKLFWAVLYIVEPAGSIAGWGESNRKQALNLVFLRDFSPTLTFRFDVCSEMTLIFGTVFENNHPKQSDHVRSYKNWRRWPNFFKINNKKFPNLTDSWSSSIRANPLPTTHFISI